MNISPPKKIQDIEPYLQLDTPKFVITSKIIAKYIPKRVIRN